MMMVVMMMTLMLMVTPHGSGHGEEAEAAGSFPESQKHFFLLGDAKRQCWPQETIGGWPKQPHLCGPTRKTWRIKERNLCSSFKLCRLLGNQDKIRANPTVPATQMQRKFLGLLGSRVGGCSLRLVRQGQRQGPGSRASQCQCQCVVCLCVSVHPAEEKVSGILVGCWLLGGSKRSSAT